MNINRILIGVLLIVLIYIIYRYQDIIVCIPDQLLQSSAPNEPKKEIKKEQKKDKKVRIKETDVNLDNISQVSIGSLENSADPYPEDSMLGTLDSNKSNNTLTSLFN